LTSFGHGEETTFTKVHCNETGGRDGRRELVTNKSLNVKPSQFYNKYETSYDSLPVIIVCICLSALKKLEMEKHIL